MVELSGNIRLPLAACDLRALRALRQGMMLYLELVVAGMPPAVLQCQCCVLSNGSFKVLCFDGLYVGIRAKHRRDMTRIKVALDIAAGAVASCSLADSKGKIEALRFKSIGAVKGAVYAIATLSPEVLFDLPGGAQDGGDEGDPESEHGLPQFDPVKENKVHPALVDFIRTVLLGKDVSIVAVLVAVIDRAGQYDRFIQADGDDPIEAEPPLTRHSVASGDLGRPVTPIEFEQLWLVQPLVLNSLRDVYGDKRVAAASDFHRSGIFCPLLPPLRPGLDFQNGGRRTEEDSTCEKDYGFAKLVNTSVDAFHFRKSHKTCSSARCPTSFESLLGVNTLSSEQRNAATKRLVSFIRLLNQRNFLTFSAYQQCLSNIMAMYRGACDEVESSAALNRTGWPQW
ncbi:hypothetical protein I4F81_006015 [Pyropia yezoensis]|uniref:Uncharacterized protein n=1 Tax=Pyropia yezoensis TaxID=2788 RepID=A0ACC3BZQ8_PYRYE|nr:hypothetical protein I4F81_006015 [Neopyropia yezoensis]